MDITRIRIRLDITGIRMEINRIRIRYLNQDPGVDYPDPTLRERIRFNVIHINMRFSINIE